jgi:hypothetical protein
MKKHLSIWLVAIALSSCQHSSDNSKVLQARVDSLENKLANTYRPGLGEFMSGIQVHHAKLWFAAKNENWPLADFEVHEIMEALDDIKTFNTDRPEIKQLPMIQGPLDSVNAAIQSKDATKFNKAFQLLTTTCNNCHQVTNHAFNVIKIPDTPPFSNQDFNNVK